MVDRAWSRWRIAKGAALVLGALTVIGGLWLSMGMIFFALNAQLVGAVIFYSLLAAAAFLVGRWVWRRLYL